ncbi:MAG: DUF2779 domain-containing protein [Elusimicrobia bacterium]|nr:DUF2779 domain-containing protein [Elusimicrobiota bacterium]
MRLSKSKYIRGLQCHKSLWLYSHRKDLIPEAPPALQLIFDQGHRVGELAWKRFPGGSLIKDDHDHIPEAVESTKAAVSAGKDILFEAAMMHDGVLVRPDVLVRVKGRRSWDLIEVKGATEVKDVYLEDVGIQKYVLEGAGFPIRKACLMLVNNEYVRQGDVDPQEFFVLSDVTREAAPLQAEIPGRVRAMFAMLACKEVPAMDIGPHCHDPYDCDFIHHCWEHVPDYSVFDLCRARYEKIRPLLDQSILRIKDIPAGFPLTNTQELQVMVEKSRKPHIDGEGIAEALKEPAHPLYYLDFETINPAIPPYDGLKPFQQTPFQASLHVQEKPGGPLKHHEHLGDAKTDPRPGLVRFLLDNIGPSGSILAYNAGFEGGRLKEMAEAFPKHAKRLISLRERLWDLAGPFRNRLYMHPEFKGRWSIKAVLPAMVPGMGYEGMAIAEGTEASIAYLNLMEGKLSKAEAQKTIAALKAYCGQDTLGMAKLWEALRKIAAI